MLTTQTILFTDFISKCAADAGETARGRGGARRTRERRRAADAGDAARGGPPGTPGPKVV